MKLWIYLFAFTILTGKTTAQPTRSTGDLASGWIMLTEVNGEHLIFNPCDAANGRIAISPSQMEVSEGHDAVRFDVVNTYKEDNGRYHFDLRNGEERHSYYFRYMTGRKDRGYWSFDPSEPGILYIAEQAAGDVRTVDQPCEDCWDDCE